MHHVKEKIDQVLEKFLIVLETVIAIFSTIVLVGLLVDLILHIFLSPSHAEKA